MALTTGLARYRPISNLGSGGMATVVLAEDAVLGRRVALKRVGVQSGTSGLLRLRREALIGASISHPNLVSIYDVLDLDGEEVVIVMEYVPGEDLESALRREASLGSAGTLRVIEGVAAGLDAIHGHGIVHRDVKPPNILLGSSGSIKLADLGIASTPEHTRITTAGQVVGSFRYMAPEQLEDAPATPAIDVYALAAVAFEALSGRKAREESTPLAVAHAIASQPPPDLLTVWPQAPPAAAEVLRRGMARDPAARPRSAGELAARLRAALEPEPTRPAAAVPVAPPARGAGAAGAVLGAGAAGAGLGAAAAGAGLGAAAAGGAAADRGAGAAQAGARPAPAAVQPGRPAQGTPSAGAASAARPRPDQIPRVTMVPPRRRRSARDFLPAILLAAILLAVGAAVILSQSGSTSGSRRAAGSGSTTTRTTPTTPSAKKSSTTGASSTAASGAATTPTGTTPTTPSATTPAPTAVGAGTPVGAVETFYELAAAHRYAQAWALADPAFRSQLQGYNAFAAQQSGTYAIAFKSAKVISRSADAATVAISTTATRNDGTHQCSGTVDEVPGAGATWLLHQISINCT